MRIAAGEVGGGTSPFDERADNFLASRSTDQPSPAAPHIPAAADAVPTAALLEMRIAE